MANGVGGGDMLENYSYITAAIMAVWDNVEGARKLKTWRSSHPVSEDVNYVPEECLEFVSNHSLVAGVSGNLVDVEVMFYCLNNHNVIATSFLFTVSTSSRSLDRDLFCLSIVLPLSELAEWLCRHTLLVKKMKCILKYNLIPNIERLAKQVGK